MIAFSGVRSSCDMLARNSLLCWLASSSSRLLSANSRVRSSTFCSRSAYDSRSCAAMALNWSASVSSSSPVRTSIRWSRSPCPMRAAPACSARMGVSILRTRNRLARTAMTRPRSSSSAVRRIEARIGCKRLVKRLVDKE